MLLFWVLYNTCAKPYCNLAKKCDHACFLQDSDLSHSLKGKQWQSGSRVYIPVNVIYKSWPYYFTWSSMHRLWRLGECAFLVQVLPTQQIPVHINGWTSKMFDAKYGIPQGSCLGPLLFILYASKLIKYHLPDAHAVLHLVQSQPQWWAIGCCRSHAKLHCG